MKGEWDTPFIGRESELRHVRHALQAANSGEPQFVVIGGGAGIGKSRLVNHALQAYEHRASTLLFRTPCIDARESPLSFAPIVTLLKQFDRLMDDITRNELVAPVRQQLSELIPAITPTRVNQQSATRSQLFESITTLLEKVSQKGLVAIVVEDLHWADRSTLDLLLFAAATAANARLAVFMTYRDDEPIADDFVIYLAQLQRNINVTRIHLPEMKSHELTQHIYDVADGLLDPDFVSAVCKRSRGNPFYAEEMIKAAVAGDNTVPQTLRDMLLARTSGIDENTRIVLQALSVGGQSVDTDSLAAVLSSLNIQNPYDVIRRTIDTGLVDYHSSSETVCYRHALLGELMYSELLPGERRNLHKEWATALSASRDTTPADLARHYVQSKQAAEAVVTSLKAANAAEQSAGFAEAAIHFDNALSMWDEAQATGAKSGLTRADVLRRSANAHHLAGNNDAAIDRAHLSLDEVDVEDLPLAMVDLGCYMHAAGRSVDALDVHSRAVKQSEDLSNPHKAKVMLAHAQSLSAMAFHRDAVETAQQAIQHSLESDVEFESTAANLMGHDLVVLGSEAEGLSYLRKALELAKASNDASNIADAYKTLASTLAGPLNRLQEALDVAKEGIECVNELGLDRHWGVSLRSVLLDTLFRMGRWSEADDIITQAFRKGPRGAAAIELHLARAKLALGSGDFALANEDLDATADLTARAVEVRYNVPLATLRAGHALWHHNFEEAASHIDKGLEFVQDSDDVWFVGPLLWHGIRAHAGRALQVRSSGNESQELNAITRATQFYEDLQERAKATDAHGALASMLSAYEWLGQGEISRVSNPTDAEPWRHVASIWKELGHPYPMAYAQYRLAEALSLARRRTNETTTALCEAFATAEKMEALPLRLEIEALAQRTGIDVFKAMTDNPDVVDVRESIELAPGTPALTRRELQVLDLVAAGKGNRAIADDLFISEKTASVHVSNIMTKLGASSRGEVAAMVHRARH